MANVNIKFNGKEFLLSCDDGQEEHLEELSLHLNKKFNELKNNLGNIGENKLLLITSITVMDGYFETKKKVDQKKLIGEKCPKKYIFLRFFFRTIFRPTSKSFFNLTFFVFNIFLIKNSVQSDLVLKRTNQVSFVFVSRRGPRGYPTSSLVFVMCWPKSTIFFKKKSRGF